VKIRVACAAFVVLMLMSCSVLGASASAADVPPFCLPGSGAGQCTDPQGVAVDTSVAEPTSGHVYVADRGNNRIDVFESDGKSISSFPVLSAPTWVAVDNDPTSPSVHDVYVSSDGFAIGKFKPNGEAIETLGSKGNGSCQLERANDPVAVSSGSGNLYVADSYDKGGGTFVNRVISFGPTGACLATVTLFEGQGLTISNLAVDSNENVYVTVEGAGLVLRKYAPDGTLLAELGKDAENEGIAVDAADNVYAKQFGFQLTKSAVTYFITKYSPTGTVLRRFEYVPRPIFVVHALAAYPSPEGDLYASEGSEGINYLTEPAPGPVIVPEACKAGTRGSIKATLQGEVNPEGKATSFHFEYLTQAQFEAGGGFETGGIPNPALQKSDETPLGGDPDFELREAAIEVKGLTPETKYHCRLVAKNAEGEAPAGPDGTFFTKEGFEFGPAWTVKVGETVASLNVEGNPLGLAAKGQIEYVTDAQYKTNPDHFAEAQSAPSGEIDFGASEAMQLRNVDLSGLTPGTLYHWRLRARNGAPPEGVICPEQKPACPELEHTFRTYLPEAPGVDDRGYELVSPAEKNSAEVVVPGWAGGLTEERTIRVQAGSGSGEAVTYTSWTSFGDAESAPATSQYLSKRTPTGWSTENISPLGFEFSILFPPYSGFDPDLSAGAVKVSEPPLTTDCPAGFENLYLRDNIAGTLNCLTPEAPNLAPGRQICFDYAGASADQSRVFFASTAAYAGAPKSEDFLYSLYEWSAADGKLRVVSVLPGQSEATAPTEGTAFGPRGSLNGVANCQVGQSILRNVVSADGSRAFWTYVPEEASITLATTAPGAQTITIADADGGTFTLSFLGQTTSPIAYKADDTGAKKAAAVQEALEALSTIGAGNVEVTGAAPYTVTFKGPLTGTTSLLSANGSALTDVPTQLLVRINGTETVQLDEIPSTHVKAGGGVFWAASTDGSVVYFTDENRLISGSKSGPGEPDLYRYEIDKPSASRLSDLTKGPLVTGAGDVRGVVGASDDGSYVYFVAGAVLSGEEENQAGLKAKAGEDNLYVFHEGSTRFIATLSEEDNKDWESQPKIKTARVSPDGRHLAFLSIEAEALAGYDNTMLEGEHCRFDQINEIFLGSRLCPQAFLYDAESKDLTCASCNPSGSRPLGQTLLLGWSNMYEGPRYLSDDGSRLFFESYDSLVQGDENGKRDVYEFERPGSGDCSDANSNFDPLSGGCHFLVSSGKSQDNSYLVDASSNGRDVFFSTRAKMVGWDTNDNFDVYDYRQGGGFSEPPLPSVPCAGEESCKPPATLQPPAPAPITPTFTGPGSAKAKPKPKHHKKKHHKKKHKQKHSSQKQRSSR
jgi:hypothetical protein